MTKSECGTLGGTVTFERYGREEMVRRGKLGGRPRSLTISEIRRQQSQAAEKILKEVLGGKRKTNGANKTVGAVS